MPRFDYQCRKCNHVFEREHPLGSEPRVRCPVCKAGSKKLISQVGVVFKGSGFYCTDQKKAGGNGSGTNGTKVDVDKKEVKEIKKTSSDD